MKILTESESTEHLAMDQAVQVLAKGAAQSPAEQAQQIKQVTAEDVKKVKFLKIKIYH
jgi:predicted Zn-dependent peptidase